MNVSWMHCGRPLPQKGKRPQAHVNGRRGAAHDLIDLDACVRLTHPCFIFVRRRYEVVMARRGCPFGCSYRHIVYGRMYWYRSPENVV